MICLGLNEIQADTYNTILSSKCRPIEESPVHIPGSLGYEVPYSYVLDYVSFAYLCDHTYSQQIPGVLLGMQEPYLKSTNHGSKKIWFIMEMS